MDNNQQNTARLVRLEDLGALLKARRKSDGLTLEHAAKQSKISAATLSRLERNATPDRSKSMPIPDMRTLDAVARWLGVSLETVFDLEAGSSVQENAPYPDVVEAHLRADPNLDPKAAEALATMFRVAYQQFSKQAMDIEKDRG